ncbi:MAG: GNAT family N-acetyltransferase [Planctomycetaceae bacterium]|nr:GNAT family N-acetyltransferase [Planctomycetaceae bacterium]
MPSTAVQSKQFRPATVPAGLAESWIELATTVEELQAHLAEWEDLTCEAIEINAYYEPWLLIPALQHTSAGLDVTVALIYRAIPEHNEKQLIGLFPLERHRPTLRQPYPQVSLWQHDYCYLATPLIRRGFAAQCWELLLDWLKTDRHLGGALDLSMFPAEGPVYQHLVDQMRQRRSISFCYEVYTRAYFWRRENGDSYITNALSSRKQRDLRRKWRRLEDLGKLEFRTLSEPAVLDQWIDDFIRLEASGWKGERSTAINCKPGGRECMTSALRDAFARGQLLLTGLFLNDEPIAMRCSFVTAPGSFFFKPAYNEDYAQYSPGVHVELETIRLLHERTAISWMDSCTSPDNVLLNQIWMERRTYQTLLIATRGLTASFCLGVIRPALRWFSRSFRKARMSVER